MQMASNDRSGLEGTPIYMAPELFDRQRAPERGHRRPTCTRSAGLAEPYTEIALPWDIAKAVVAGKRPEWPADRRVPDWFAVLFAACGRQVPPGILRRGTEKKKRKKKKKEKKKKRGSESSRNSDPTNITHLDDGWVCNRQLCP
jgi:hypothetical protein